MSHCVNWGELPETISPSGVRKRVLQGSGASLAMLRVPAGTTAERHSHPHEQFVQVIEGSGLLETEVGEQRFGPGSVFHFPANTWHSAVFESDTVLVETNLDQ